MNENLKTCIIIVFVFALVMSTIFIAVPPAEYYYGKYHDYWIQKSIEDRNKKYNYLN